LLVVLAEVSGRIPVVFPIHPRTRARLEAEPSLQARAEGARGLKLVDPIGYLDFLALTANARLVITDSGGIQEETTALGVPCLTVRHNTERPVTVEVGSNALVGTDPAQVVPAALAVLEGRGQKGRVPDLWDGRAAERIAPILVRFCEERGR
jgi:UDP-N-acetylglucosamine 2-epimerase (non-hydrolysing)